MRVPAHAPTHLLIAETWAHLPMQGYVAAEAGPMGVPYYFVACRLPHWPHGPVAGAHLQVRPPTPASKSACGTRCYAVCLLGMREA